MISRTLVSVAVCAALAAGCGVGVEASAPSADVQITSAPVGIEDSPQVVYEGRPTYLYQDHWYYRDGNQWRVRGNEPADLAVNRRRLQTQTPRTQTRHVEQPREERKAHGHER